MPNTYFQFRQFRINQEKSGMKITTDACLFGAWVANQIMQSGEEPKRILDIGTGTGLLALMIAQVTQNSIIDAIEVNEETYAEASDNFQQSEWNDRLSCYHTPAQHFKAIEKYDLVICNPPFFAASLQGNDGNKNQALHDDSLSKKELLKAIVLNISSRGKCYLLYPEYEMESFKKICSQGLLHQRQRVLVKNKVRGPVFRVMSEFYETSIDSEDAEINIRREDGKYTDEFWNLLKPYYLSYNDPNYKAGFKA